MSLPNSPEDHAPVNTNIQSREVTNKAPHGAININIAVNLKKLEQDKEF